MKHSIYEFSLFLKILCFESKESLNFPEDRCLLVGRVQCILEHNITCSVENIAYHRIQSISVPTYSLVN